MKILILLRVGPIMLEELRVIRWAVCFGGDAMIYVLAGCSRRNLNSAVHEGCDTRPRGRFSTHHGQGWHKRRDAVELPCIYFDRKTLNMS